VYPAGAAVSPGGKGAGASCGSSTVIGSGAEGAAEGRSSAGWGAAAEIDSAGGGALH
jgi:hypothetical protein